MVSGLKQRLTKAWKAHPLVTSAFLVMTVLTLALAIRLGASIAYWSTHRNLPVESWMPLGYIGRSHSIPPEEMRRIANLPPDARDRRPIGEIAKERGMSSEALIRQIEEGIERFRQENAVERRE